MGNGSCSQVTETDAANVVDKKQSQFSLPSNDNNENAVASNKSASSTLFPLSSATNMGSAAITGQVAETDPGKILENPPLSSFDENGNTSNPVEPPESSPLLPLHVLSKISMENAAPTSPIAVTDSGKIWENPLPSPDDENGDTFYSVAPPKSEG